MSREISEVVKDALALPQEARAALVDALLDSLDSEVDEAAEAAWQDEISRRAKELSSGEILPTPWSDVRTRLMAAAENER